jgi:predicted transcriptional regulator
MDWREIEAELKALGVSLGAFYARASIHRATWQRLREGKFEPRADTVRRINAALRVLRAEKTGNPPGGGGSDDSSDVECARIAWDA